MKLVSGSCSVNIEDSTTQSKQMSYHMMSCVGDVMHQMMSCVGDVMYQLMSCVDDVMYQMVSYGDVTEMQVWKNRVLLNFSPFLTRHL